MPRIPQLDSRPFLKLCGSGFRPIKITGMLQMWLIQHFARAENIKEVGLEERIWNPDNELSKIQILPLEDWRPQNTEQRPALIIKQQEIKFIRYGIDNRLMGGGGPFATRRMHAAGMQGSHTVFCIAGEGGEALQLAAEVALQLMQFAPIVERWLDMLRLELVGIGELSKLEEATENFVVPINIAYAWLEQWELIPLDDPIITGIQAMLNPVMI